MTNAESQEQRAQARPDRGPVYKPGPSGGDQSVARIVLASCPAVTPRPPSPLPGRSTLGVYSVRSGLFGVPHSVERRRSPPSSWRLPNSPHAVFRRRRRPPPRPKRNIQIYITCRSVTHWNVILCYILCYNITRVPDDRLQTINMGLILVTAHRL